MRGKSVFAKESIGLTLWTYTRIIGRRLRRTTTSVMLEKMGIFRFLPRNAGVASCLQSDLCCLQCNVWFWLFDAVWSPANAVSAERLERLFDERIYGRRRGKWKHSHISIYYCIHPYTFSTPLTLSSLSCLCAIKASLKNEPNKKSEPSVKHFPKSLKNMSYLTICSINTNQLRAN